MNPKISVIMAVYNAEKYLNEAIDSILNQSFEEFEFIIINDGSIDESLNIIKSYKDSRIIVITKNNEGAAKARNYGVQVAKCDFIAIQDSDDISFSNRLEKQYEFLKLNTDYIVVGSNAEIIDTNGNFIFYSDVKTTNREIKNKIKKMDAMNKMPFFNPSVMFRKSVFYKAGQFSEYMENTYEDLILYCKMANYGKMKNLSEYLIKYRISPSSLSGRNNKIEVELNKIVSKAVEYDKISKSDYLFLKNRIEKIDSTKKLFYYHLYLSKKYLWNNYQPKLARINLIKAYKINPFSFEIYFYFLLSYLPKKIISLVYNYFKNIKSNTIKINL